MKKDRIVLHHSTTADGRTLSVPIIRRNHKRKGWDDIGYHVIFERFQRSGAPANFEALLGRDLDSQGAGEYRQRMNRRGIHVLFVGDFDAKKPAVAMLEFGARHVAALAALVGIPPERTHIIGHREIAGVTKSCPGDRFDLDDFVHRVQVHT